MGLFNIPIPKDPTPSDLVDIVVANCQIWQDDGCEYRSLYLLETFAMPMLQQAIEKIKKDHGG